MREWTPALVKRRIADARSTVERMRDRIAADPTSVKVPKLEERIAELDVAIQVWSMEFPDEE